MSGIGTSMPAAAMGVRRHRPQYETASAGKQTAASLIDCAALVLVVCTTFIVGHDGVLTLIVGFESALALMVWEGTRGVTPGNLFTGTRTVREECITVPDGGVLPAGMLRIARKYGVLLLAALVFGVGLIVEACSPRFPSKDSLTRSWANQAASLIAVDIKRPSETPPAPQVPSPASAFGIDFPAPVVSAAPPELDNRTSLSPYDETVTPKGRLVVYLENGAHLDLPESGTIIVGRKPTPVDDGDLTMVLDDSTGTVSRNHARLELKGDEMWVTDLGSLNGTFIEGDGEERRLLNGVPEQVLPGTRLSLGDLAVSIMMTVRGRTQ